MVFIQINSFDHKMILQDEDIKKIKKENLILEDKLKELTLEVKELKKLLNSLIN